MRLLGCVSIHILLFLLTDEDLTMGNPLPDSGIQNQAVQRCNYEGHTGSNCIETHEASCSTENPLRSTDSLYIGNGDPKSVLRLEFPLSTLTSNLSSFDLRTFDSEGIIFYGDVGEHNWFVLGLRERRLEVQMSNGNGQMVLSKWGPDMSDGQWRKVTVDSSTNTIDVRVDGEIVVMLTHHVNNQAVAPENAKLNIILGDLPGIGKTQLLRPLSPALDACMKNWAWVKKDTEALDYARETDENRQCFQNEEWGAFFPSHGYAILKPASLPSHTSDAWHLSIHMSFRVQEDGGVVLALHGTGNIAALTITLDVEKQVLEASLLDKLRASVTFPPGICLRNWHTVEVLIQSNQITLKSEETTSSIDIPPADFKALEDIWLDPDAFISVGGSGMAEHSEQGPRFSGCLKMTLQGAAVDLDSAHYKHPHVRSHSCPAI
ncbi:sex hormone-binding globulin [Gastrophryne carolinensis]